MDALQKYQYSTLLDVLNPKTIQEASPVLLVGKAVSLFKTIYKDPIRELKNTNDVKEFVTEYTGIKSSKPVVISDIGYLTKNAAFLVLKLVEEAKFPVIILSTEDKVDSILLSRVKRTVKFPMDERTNNSLMSVSSAFGQVYGNDESNQTRVVNKIQFYAENCPELYRIESEVPYNKYRNAMIEILGGYHDKV